MPEATPPPKRQKTYIELSEDDSPPPSLPTRSTRRISTNTSAAASRRPVSNAASVKPTNIALSLSKSRGTEPLTTTSKHKTASTASKKQSPSTLKAKKSAAPNRSIYSFFAGPQGLSSASRAPTAPTLALRNGDVNRVPSCSPHEDADDLIEDLSDEEHLVLSLGLPPPKPARERSGPVAHTLTVSKPGAGDSLRSFLGSKGSRSSTPVGSTAKALALPAVDTRPWAEKYAPKETTDLAVNKTKVEQVRSWLRRVFSRSTKQRLLVLRGSAGAGKTTTVDLLAREMGFEVMEWRSPSSAIGGDSYGEDGAFANGLSGLFEEFLGRAGKFGSLELTSGSGTGKSGSSQPITSSQFSTSSKGEQTKPKVIVIEDFPNALFTSSSAPLTSFRHTIKSFLALPAPAQHSSSLPPLVLIISETPSVTGPNAFTAHRLLSPEILHHPLTSEIVFNKIAPTFMLKALSSIVSQECKHSERKFGPSKPLMEALSTSGDIRSAVMGLEFLSVNGDSPAGGFAEQLQTADKKRRKKPATKEMNEAERGMLQAVTQRESSFGIFHAVGKVVYNKRYGDDPEDPYVPPPPRPPLSYLPYHSRASRVPVDTLIDETGTDPQTFIAAIHENYLGSCNLLGGLARDPDASSLDPTNSCLDQLSDADLLAGRGFSGYHDGMAADTAGIRADEIAFQVAVRGVCMALPSPVKRAGSGPQKMFYPLGSRLWRDREEVADTVAWYVGRERADGIGACGRQEALMDRLPYLKVLEDGRNRGSFFTRAQRKPLDKGLKTALNKVATFKGVGRQSEDIPEDEEPESEGGPETDAPKSTGPSRKWEKKRTKVTWAEDVVGGSDAKAGVESIESLVLSDDDIEDF